ncbi:MAG: hypothetical protein ACT4P7_21570 [Gemmatimonadaceae bacterium]
MTSTAVAQHHHDPRADSIVAAARKAMGTLRDTTALRQAGWNAIGFGGGVKDLSPFQGQHWILGPRFAMNPPVELSQPNFLMYLAVGDSLIPIGVAYTRRIAPAEALPDSLAGAAAEWHGHMFCRAVPDEGNVLADGPEDCEQRGGTPARNKIAMIHTWIVPNPDGPYAHDNPALPYIATGLESPASPSRDDRLFGVALGETYGAKLFIAHRIERDLRRKNLTPEGLSRLQELRTAMRELVPQLRAAERDGDTKRFDTLRKKLVEGWSAIADQYRGLALTPGMRARFDLELTQALDRPHKHM